MTMASEIVHFPDDNNSGDFDPDFTWGAGTSSYQVEGAASEGGRLVGGNNVVDAYHKTNEDVQTMKKMGINAYRFSLSWSRILPGGKLKLGINQEGINYYNNLIDELLANGIEPYVTLWHWDTPNVLEGEYMGFLSDKIVGDFVNYAEFCFWEFGDRVKNWSTLNEPQAVAYKGYATGVFPPARGGEGMPGNPATEPYIAAHNLLLSHAYAVKLYQIQMCLKNLLSYK